jgi:hypothetical protein
MPKPLVITIAVEEIAFGKIFRTLDGAPGVISLTFHQAESPKHKSLTNGADQEDEPRPPKQKKSSKVGKPRPIFAITGRDFLMNNLRKSPMTRAALGAAFVKAGRSAASVSSLTHTAINQGDIEKTADGYMLTRKAKDRLRHKQSRKQKKKTPQAKQASSTQETE